MTPERKAKISAAAKRRWAKLRAEPGGPEKIAQITAHARRVKHQSKIGEDSRFTFDPLLMTAMFKKS